MTLALTILAGLTLPAIVAVTLWARRARRPVIGQRVSPVKPEAIQWIPTPPSRTPVVERLGRSSRDPRDRRYAPEWAERKP